MNARADPPSARKPGSTVSQLAKPRLKSATRLLGLGLVANDARTWARAGIGLRVRLTRSELAALAFTSLRALDPETRWDVAEAALWGIPE